MRSAKRKTIADYCNEGHSRTTAAFLTWFKNNTTAITNVVTKKSIVDMIKRKLNEAENNKDVTVLSDLLDNIDIIFEEKRIK